MKNVSILSPVLKINIVNINYLKKWKQYIYKQY